MVHMFDDVAGIWTATLVKQRFWGAAKPPKLLVGYFFPRRGVLITCEDYLNKSTHTIDQSLHRKIGASLVHLLPEHLLECSSPIRKGAAISRTHRPTRRRAFPPSQQIFASVHMCRCRLDTSRTANRTNGLRTSARSDGRTDGRAGGWGGG